MPWWTWDNHILNQLNLILVRHNSSISSLCFNQFQKKKNCSPKILRHFYRPKHNTTSWQPLHPRYTPPHILLRTPPNFRTPTVMSLRNTFCTRHTVSRGPFVHFAHNACRTAHIIPTGPIELEGAQRESCVLDKRVAVGETEELVSVESLVDESGVWGRLVWLCMQLSGSV